MGWGLIIVCLLVLLWTFWRGKHRWVKFGWFFPAKGV
jgi:hypothetical protein